MMDRIFAADGHALDCWIEPAQGTKRGGIVVIQEIFGVTEQLKGVARRYAQQGYVVAIPALFDRAERGAVIPFEEAPRGRDLMMASKLDETMADLAAAVARLREEVPRVGVIGFCWGGGLALRAAQVLDVQAGVAFYGTRLASYHDKPLKAPMLMHVGRTDDHTPRDLVDQTCAMLPGIEVHWYDAGHAFANEARPAVYVAGAAETAHERTLDFLNHHVG